MGGGSQRQATGPAFDEFYFSLFPQDRPKPPPEAAPAAAPFIPSPASAASFVAPPAETPAPAPVEPLGPAIDPGGGIDQPSNSIGGDLGGAVLNPPKYWVGGIDTYGGQQTQQSGRGTGALKVARG